eukprot:Sspe_Gene.61628::Locus_34250_Transcript_1_1_Confidence_1.000_Length_1724::g.61628::m.61628
MGLVNSNPVLPSRGLDIDGNAPAKELFDFSPEGKAERAKVLVRIWEPPSEGAAPNPTPAPPPKLTQPWKCTTLVSPISEAIPVGFEKSPKARRRQRDRGGAKGQNGGKQIDSSPQPTAPASPPFESKPSPSSVFSCEVCGVEWTSEPTLWAGTPLGRLWEYVSGKAPSRTVLEYIIKCTVEDSSWEVRRRFSAFFALHTSLKGIVRNEKLPDVPRRTVVRLSSPHFASQRMDALNKYLRELMQLQTAALSPQIRRFLKCLQEAPNQALVPVASPMRGVLSAGRPSKMLELKREMWERRAAVTMKEAAAFDTILELAVQSNLPVSVRQPPADAAIGQRLQLIGLEERQSRKSVWRTAMLEWANLREVFQDEGPPLPYHPRRLRVVRHDKRDQCPPTGRVVIVLPSRRTWRTPPHDYLHPFSLLRPHDLERVVIPPSSLFGRQLARYVLPKVPRSSGVVVRSIETVKAKDPRLEATLVPYSLTCTVTECISMHAPRRVLPKKRTYIVYLPLPFPSNTAH